MSEKETNPALRKSMLSFSEETRFVKNCNPAQTVLESGALGPPDIDVTGADTVESTKEMMLGTFPIASRAFD